MSDFKGYIIIAGVYTLTCSDNRQCPFKDMFIPVFLMCTIFIKGFHYYSATPHRNNKGLGSEYIIQMHLLILYVCRHILHVQWESFKGENFCKHYWWRYV